MKQGTDYPINTAIALLLAGDTGTGKSTSLLYWPRPWILDLEGNLAGAVKTHTKRLGKRPEFCWDTPELNDAGAPVALKDQWKRCEELVNRATSDPTISTICIDGLGRLYDKLKAYLANLPGEKAVVVAGQNVMGLSQWGVYPDLLRRFVWDLRSKGKPIIVTAHLTVDEGEMSQIREYRIADLQTAFGKSNSLPKCFSDYWQTLSTPCAKDPAKNPRGVKYVWRTAPNARNPSLKTSFPELPDELEAGDPIFLKVLTTLETSLPKTGNV